jgi:hypothetical protein
MSWRYKAIKVDDDTWAIVEEYDVDGEWTGATTGPVRVLGDTEEGLIEVLNMMINDVQRGIDDKSN